MVETPQVGDEQLALLLQIARDAALVMLEDSGGFMPFGARAKSDGEVELVRYVEEAKDELLEEVYKKIQSNLAGEARQGEILAAATVANVHLADEDAGEDFQRAIQVHVEAPEFSRVVLVPYRFPEVEQVKLRRDVETGAMIPFEAPPAVFAG